MLKDFIQGLKAIGVEDDTATKVLTAIATFFSLGIVGHVATDIAAIIKGLANPK